jgi:hypothetical protein
MVAQHARPHPSLRLIMEVIIMEILTTEHPRGPEFTKRVREIKNSGRTVRASLRYLDDVFEVLEGMDGIDAEGTFNYLIEAHRNGVLDYRAWRGRRLANGPTV